MYVSSTGGHVMPRRSMAERKVRNVSRGHSYAQLVIGDAEGPGKIVECESNLEKLVTLILLARPGVLDLETQVGFPWMDEEGKLHTHYFDIVADMADGSRIAIMVKAKYVLKSEKFMRSARLIASQVGRDFADEVTIMTNDDIDPIERFNAELIYGKRHSHPEADAIAHATIQGLHGDVTVGELVTAMGMGGSGFGALVRQIARGRLTLTEHERIDYGTTVRKTRGH